VNRSVALGTALAGPLLAGVGMSFGQTFAPESLHPLFNSAAPVAAVAAASALAGRRLWQAVTLAALAGHLMMFGYYATAALRGYGVSSFWVLFWCTAGVAVGATVGAAVWMLRLPGSNMPSPLWPGLAAAVWPGIALGEAAHGIARIADSTPVGYWWAEVAVGVAVLATLCVTAVRSRSGIVAALLGTAVIAGGLYLVYGIP
jgi:hypothetical protein